MVKIIVKPFRFIFKMVMISFMIGLIIGFVCSKEIVTINFHPDKIDSPSNIKNNFNDIKDIINNVKDIFNDANFSTVVSSSSNLNNWGKKINNAKLVSESTASKNHTPTFFHIVKYGETLISIGRRYKVHYKVIMKINDIKNPNELKKNDQLIIPDIQYY